MITTGNLRQTLAAIGFTETAKGLFTKVYHHFNHAELRVDFNSRQIIYPEGHGLRVNDRTSSGNFDHAENFVVLECVTRLLDKGYRPEHIELEKRWQLGHNASGGKADICVMDERGDSMLLIIECKQAGRCYSEALARMREDGGQLFSYWQQERSTQWLALYCSDFKDGAVHYENAIVKCTDDNNILMLAEKDRQQPTYRRARTAEELVTTWKETYSQSLHADIVFASDTVAYRIGIRPLLKKDLRDFSPADGIVNRFEEILRHNNVSDKENAFNRLVALFICKLVDEMQKGDQDEVDFQYKVGTDTYESLQDRLQRLHQKGMRDFMQEEVNYVDDGYAERVFSQYAPARRRKAVEDLRATLRILKYYTNNDFTFKDVHNEELFYQNGKVLVEVVQLFEKFRIVYPAKHQFLGDLFEQLLNKGFKQNEGQFFTPMPITRFIWDCIPLDKVCLTAEGYRLPRVIDYACGAGHFLTEAVEAVDAYFRAKGCEGQVRDNLWVERHIFGVEKDYRLARVAKVCLYMNGAGKGQIVFGDGLEQYRDKGVSNGTFDILVANPPYSVDSFKPHLKLKDNNFGLLAKISNDGSEIETLFVERIAQLLQPKGVAAVVLPSSLLSNDKGSYTAAREELLEHFLIRAVAQFGSKTFGATGTNTVVLFLEKYDEPPRRMEQVKDSVEAILAGNVSDEWEDRAILDAYLQKIQVAAPDYDDFTRRRLRLDQLEAIPYFAAHVAQFLASTRLRDLQKTQRYRRLDKERQEAETLSLFYSTQLQCEREKLYYFALVYHQRTLIITAPDKNDEQQRFLGYTWSNRRGNEGIRIITPGGMLYNDADRLASGTLAAAVRRVYSDLQPDTPERERFYTFTRLQDMIDFTRPDFNKAIKLTPEKKSLIKSKYPLVALGGPDGVCEIRIGGTPARANASYFTGNNLWVSIAEMKGQTITDTKEKITDEAVRHSNVKLVPKGTTLLSFKLSIGKTAIAGADLYTNEAIAALIPKDTSVVSNEYLFNVFNSGLINLNNVGNKAFGKSLNSTYLNNEVKIPLPPINIQQQIVDECQKVDEDYNSSRMTVEEYRSKIAKVFEDLEVIARSGAASAGGGQTTENKRVNTRHYWTENQSATRGDTPGRKIPCSHTRGWPAGVRLHKHRSAHHRFALDCVR